MEEVRTDKFGVFAWVLFSLAILNFFNTGVLRFYVGIAMCVAIIVLLLTSEGWHSLKGLKKITFFSLLVFTFIYGLNVYRFQFVDFSHFLMYALSPALFYIAGHYLATRSGDNRYKYLVNCAIIASSAIFGFLCVFYTLRVAGTIVSQFGGHRYVIDWWTGSYLAATIVGTYISLGIGAMVVLFIKAESKFALIVKIILSAIVLVSLYCEYFLASRIAIVVGIVSLTATLMIIYSKSRELIRVIFWVGLFLAALYFSYTANLFDLKSTIINSPIAGRFLSTSVNGDQRLQVWRESGQGLIDHPEGGQATTLGASSAHNLWLDVGWDAGIFAFIFALVFTISSVIDFIGSARQKGMPTLLKGIIISMLISFILASFIEPIIKGVFTYFLTFCFFVAFISSMQFKQGSIDRPKIDSCSQ